MAFDFPNSPTEGQIYTPAGGPSYKYQAPRWVALSQASQTATTTEVLQGVDTNKVTTPDAIAALWERGADVAVSSASVVLGEGAFFGLAGSLNSITSLTFATQVAGRRAWLKMDVAHTLVHGATLVCTNGANIVCAVGDMIEIVALSATAVRVVSVQRYTGKALAPPAASEVPFIPAGNIAATNVQAALAELDAEKGPGFKNLLINPHGAVAQRTLGVVGDDAYMFDRWNVLSELGTISAVQIIDGEIASPVMMALYNSHGTSQRFGYEQIIEGKNCKHLHGKQVTLSARVLASNGSFTVRYAILEWVPPGVEDTVVSDVVLNWASTNYTLNNFFINNANLVVRGVASQALTSGVFADLVPLTVTLGTNFLNLIVFIWVDSAVATNTVLRCSPQFEEGSVATLREFLPHSVELELCRRYYQFNRAGFIGPVTNGTGYGGLFELKPRMRTTPTLGQINAVIATNFPGTAPAFPAPFDYLGFTVYKVANATSSGGHWNDNLFAAAEL